jgi:hypothetical protein
MLVSKMTTYLSVKMQQKKCWPKKQIFRDYFFKKRFFAYNFFWVNFVTKVCEPF